MRIGILQGVIFCFSLAAHGQDFSTKNLLDSAKSVWWADFDMTDQLVKKAEQIGVRGSGTVTNLVELYNLRIQSCNASSRIQLWRQYIDELEGFLDKNRKIFSADEYRSFSLRNRLSQAQYLVTIGDNNKALELFVNLLNEYKRLPQTPEVCEMLHTITNEIADIHRRSGEYEAAVNQFLASIRYCECSSAFYSLDYRNIGLAYFEKRDYQQTGKYLKLAEDSLYRILKKNPAEVVGIALSLYESQSSYYERLGKHDSAMLSMQKALPLLKLRNVEDAFKGRISLGLGNLYLREAKFEVAQSYLDQAERFFLNSQEDQPLQLSKVYLDQADLLDKLGKTNEALKYCDKAFERLVLNFKPDADGDPSLTELLSKKHVFRVLQKKSRLSEKLFFKKNNIKDLLRAFNTNRRSLALLDSMANEISLDKDKVILAEESYSAFEDGIRMAYRLYQHIDEKRYFDDCFALVDKGKGIVLLENLRVVNRYAGINPEWLNREKEIKSELILTEQNLYKLEIGKKNAGELASLRDRYASLKRDYANLINKIKMDAPDYYRLRFDHSVISTNAVQNQLRNGEAMIEYFVGDSTLAIIGLTNEKRFVRVKKVPSDFVKKINRFRNALINAREVEEDTTLTKMSSELSEFLVHDAIHSLGPGISSLTIIPDGILGYLPFEVFRSPGVHSKYLGEEYTIRYAYSATYLAEQMRKKASRGTYFFGGFVSSSAEQLNNEKLAALSGAEKEIAAITELMGSSYSIFNPATKDEFKNRASDFRILHLAMHSLVNEENPMFSLMVFSRKATDSTDNHLLSALELYDMSINSDLAVLSACSTGSGTLRRGEGIMSFARGFAYAGVPSAVISLWPAPDKATSKIMASFYNYLKAGESKDLALRHAKLDFIRNYPQMAAPFYWAGFILTGNKEPLEFPNSRSLYWIIAGLLIAESLLIIAKRFKKDTPLFR